MFCKKDTCVCVVDFEFHWNSSVLFTTVTMRVCLKCKVFVQGCRDKYIEAHVYPKFTQEMILVCFPKSVDNVVNNAVLV